MAYLRPHFDPDVFVSYSHGDPRGAGESPLKAWTQALIKRLENQILSLDTEFDDLRVWMDAQIDPTAHLTQDLKTRVGSSGVLIVVMSKRYLASTWCHDELEWFRDQIHWRSGDLGRVFVVRAQPTEVRDWPEFLRDERGHEIPGFWFYDRESGFPCGWPDLHDTDKDFSKELCRLQGALTKRLRELRDRAAKRAESGAAVTLHQAPTGPRRIYLHAGRDAEVARADIGRVLAQDGIVPLTAQPTANESLLGWQHDAGARMEAARRCDALALLRADDNDRFIGDLLDIGVDERDRIAVARGAALPCAVLDRTGSGLPIDVSSFGIQTFDVTQDAWRGEFRQWLDQARIATATAATP